MRGAPFLVAAWLIPGVARADHAGMAMTSTDSPSTFDAGVSLVAATFVPSQADQMGYGGNYQGVGATAGWAKGRFSVGAGWAFYRVLRNGAKAYGAGDLMVHGDVTLARRGDLTAGAMLMAAAPTGDEMMGFGMGHPMLMPSLWGMWSHDRWMASASAGYSAGLFVPAGHVHGMAPLVDPMNMSEITWSGGGEVTIAGGVHAGVRFLGGVPVGRPGIDRVVGGLRIAWSAGRTVTTAEVQTGLAGDPFTVRGILETALRF